MRRITDLGPYEAVLPYASEIFGVYQPLIGWTSARQKRRMQRGYANDVRAVLDRALAAVQPELDYAVNPERGATQLRSFGVGSVPAWRTRGTGTFLGDRIAQELPPLEELDDSVWQKLLDPRRLTQMLEKDVAPEIERWQRSQAGTTSTRGASSDTTNETARQAAEQFARESSLAGLLSQLGTMGRYDHLREVFYRPRPSFPSLIEALTHRDPLELIDPKHDIERAGLSPIGIVHLFRQYFFEFDTFLGPPVGHVWLSPGSMVELVEVSTRRTLVEKAIEQATETTIRTETSRTMEEEIAEAIKAENRSETKFGMGSTVEQGWITGSASASASLDLQSTQATARDRTHRQMRQQSEKLSTEIRRNYTSTFRTVTETTDTSSKRYVLNNTTDELVNYELRRKMRRVGVQVQDIGTYLCWQTFVDDPGRHLGIAKLVHIAKDPELGAVPPPESIPRPGPHSTSVAIDIPFVPATKDTEPSEDMDEAYRYGVEVNTDVNEGTPEKIRHKFDGFQAICDQPGYEFDSIEFDNGGQDVEIELYDVDASGGQVRFGIVLKHVNFRNNPVLRVTAKINWTPTQAVLDEVDAKNQANIAAFNEATRREFEKSYLDAARDRIEKASQVRPRRFEDLREEERIVVYRALIQDMLTRSIPMPDARTRHVVSELLNSIFDIDKMLYFVSPEWWRPRLHRSHQALGAPGPAASSGGSTGGSTGSSSGTDRARFSSVHDRVSAERINSSLSAASLARARAANTEDTSIPATSQVTWGGTGENRADNYYITEDSEPAPLGASLGWLLQLDGDAMRNAFLNAPWVKAVIPIRPGKERAAMNWLQQVHVEGADGLDREYSAPPSELAKIPKQGPVPTIREALEHLCDQVAAKHAASQEVQLFPPDLPDDEDKVRATPVDKVFEHGFHPLQGGFRVAPAEDFEVFDQWVEVLPTDQVVPVPVAYDPKTGRQL